MTITVNVNGIDETIARLETYRRGIEDRARELCRRLAQYGLVLANVRFDSAIYDGTPDWKVDVEQRDENTYVIKALGASVVFMEFGTGVVYPDDHPQAAAFGMVRGGYGKGHGSQNTWGYYGEPGSHGYEHIKANGKTAILTHGNPANMPMYNTTQDLKREIERIAREVFTT